MSLRGTSICVENSILPGNSTINTIALFLNVQLLSTGLHRLVVRSGKMKVPRPMVKAVKLRGRNATGTTDLELAVQRMV